MSTIPQLDENGNELVAIAINDDLFLESKETLCKSQFCKKILDTRETLKITGCISTKNAGIVLDVMRDDFKSTQSCTNIRDHIVVIKFLRHLAVSEDLVLKYVDNIKYGTVADFVQQCAQMPYDKLMLFIFDNARMNWTSLYPTLTNVADFKTCIRKSLAAWQFPDVFRNAVLKEITVPHIYDKNSITRQYCCSVVSYGTTKIIFRDDFDEFIGDDFIPATTTDLIFGKSYNHPLKFCIPISVARIVFGDRFNQSIRHSIPNYVTELKFGHDFNQNIRGCIPSSVLRLKFGKLFNCPIDGALPAFVKRLEFGDEFNQRVDGHISDYVEELVFGESFNQPLGHLNPYIKKIVLHRRYKFKVNDVLKSKIVWAD